MISVKIRILHTELNIPSELNDTTVSDVEWLFIDKNTLDQEASNDSNYQHAMCKDVAEPGMKAIEKDKLPEFDALFFNLGLDNDWWYNWALNYHDKPIILLTNKTELVTQYTEKWPTAEIIYLEPADRLPIIWQTIIARLKEKKHSTIDNQVKQIELAKNQESLNRITEELEDSFLRTFDLAYTDQVTGLPNRPALLQFLDSLFEPHSLVTNQNQKNALLILHIRNLANIRSSVPFETGNHILRILIDRLQSSLDRDAFLSLYKEDQFGIVLPADNVLKTAKQLIQLLEKPVEANNSQYILSCWAGTAVAPDDATETEALIQSAEIALRVARETGHKNIHIFSSEDRQRFNYRIKVETQLLKPQVTDEMYLVYQPIIDANSKKVRYLEVLVRWQSPTLGNVPPSLFIPMAEKLGFIIPLTNWILKETTKVIPLLPIDVKLSVNISPIQLLSPTLDKDLTHLLNQGNTSPNRYKIEITEGVFIEDPKEAIQRIQSLKSSGFSIALDDFGVGFSGLSYLTSLPIDSIKIDQSFLLDYPANSKSRALVDSILSLTKVFSFDSIAEGVEEEAQFQSLKEHGCNMIQGYLFFQPLKEAAMLDLFQTVNLN